MGKIRIGQIGAMHDHAGELIQTFQKMTDVYELVGLAIPEGETMLGNAAGEHVYDGVPRMSVEEMLNRDDLDAIAIETSELNLTKYAMMAVKKGLPVHMDKPGGIELKDFEALIAEVQKQGTLFHTGYMYRYNPAVQKLKKEIEEGKLGGIYCVEAHMDCGHSPAKRQWLDQFPGGMMFFLGCHLVDMICYLQGFPKEVIPYNCSTGFDGVTADDYGFAVLKYDNGVSFAKTCANELGGFMRRQLVVCGEKGTVQLLPFEAPPDEGARTALVTGVRECFNRAGGWFYKGDQYQTEPFDRYIPMMKAFASYVRKEAVNPFSPDYELEVYRTVLKACGKSGR